MKPMTVLAVLLLLINLPAFSADSNVKPVTKRTVSNDFSFIRGHKQGKQHTVTWGMTNNANITHFIVERTYEDPNDPVSVWQTVGMMPCTHMPIFKFTDTPFLPGTLTYRIKAVLLNNNVIVSPLYTIYIQ